MLGKPPGAAPTVFMADRQQPLLMGVTATPVTRVQVHVKAVNGYHAAEIEGWATELPEFGQGRQLSDVEVFAQDGRGYIFPKLMVYWLKEEITSEVYFRASSVGKFYEWDFTAGQARLRQG